MWMCMTNTYIQQVRTTHARMVSNFVCKKDFKFEVVLFIQYMPVYLKWKSIIFCYNHYARLQSNGKGFNGTHLRDEEKQHWNYYYKVSEGITDLSLNRFICHFMRRILLRIHTHWMRPPRPTIAESYRFATLLEQWHEKHCEKKTQLRLNTSRVNCPICISMWKKNYQQNE